MATRTLYGARYLELGADPVLAEFIQTKLHFLDYDEACGWYADHIDKWSTFDLALLGCNDRFFLLTTLLGRVDAVKPWLYARCREVEAEPDGFLDLWAREHYKSTIITFAGTIQEVMRDPELTVCIFSFRKDNAQAFLEQIKTEFERNAMLKEIYEDVLWEKPEKQAQKWSADDGIIVKRLSNPKEATIEASGLVDGMPTGKHFNLMIYDDVVTDKSVTNPKMVSKTTDAWELSDNLGAGDVRKWHIGTRYSFADTYGIIFERNILRPRLYPATDDGTENGNPVFMSIKRWEEKKKTQRATLAAQMLQNPIAGKEQMFKPTWFRQWEIRPVSLIVYIMGDPSAGKSATSDRTAIAAVGIDSAGNKYLLDGYRHRMSLSERWLALRTLYLKWQRAPGVQAVRVGWERYGVQADGEHFAEKMKERDSQVSFEIKELSWTREGNESKRSRVGRLEPDFRDGQFYLPAVVWEPGIGDCLWSVNEANSHTEKRPLEGRLTSQMTKLQTAGQGWRIPKPIVRKDENSKPYDVTMALVEEMMFFPFAPHDDLVDAVSRIYDMEPVSADAGGRYADVDTPDYADA